MYLPAGDKAGIERLVQYITRCPFSLSRLIRVTDTGQIVYKAEKHACRALEVKSLEQIEAVLFIQVPSPMIFADLPAPAFGQWPPA